MPYLVDTNIVVDVTRGSAKAADYLDSLGDAWLISMITYLELLAGARTQRETADLDLVLSGYQAIPPNEDITRRAYYLIKTVTVQGVSAAEGARTVPLPGGGESVLRR